MELKPCPFCGNKVIITRTDEGHTCNRCGSVGYWDWNTRPIEDELRAELRKWQTGEIVGIEFVPMMINHLEAKNAKLREALNLACMYAQDDEHDWADIVRVTSNALLEKGPLEVE